MGSKDEAGGGPPPGEALSPARRRVYTAITLSLPLLAFALVEAGLRLAGVGGLPLFVPLADTPGFLQVNPAVGRRYFPPEQAPLPGFEILRSRKSPSALRLVVQGASTSVGFPYGHHLAFSRLLRQRLERDLPDREVEVVNTSLTAVNSYTLVDLAPEIAAVQPDAVLIYAGHNEFYGAFGVGSAVGTGGGRALVRTYLRLRRLRTVELLRRLIARIGAGGSRPHDEAARPMRQVVAEELIGLDSELYAAGLEQYRENLHALLGFYGRRGVPVYVATVVSNVGSQPPLGVGEAGVAARAEFDRASALAAEGRYDEARSAYERARDLDPLRFRAPGELNRIVRDEAAEHGAVVVDAAERFRAESRGGIVDETLMTEHVHPNLRGAALLADAFREALARQEPWGESLSDEPIRAELATPLDSVLADYRVRALTSGWPFRPDGAGPVLDAVPRDAIDSLALAVYDGRLLWLEAMNAQGAYLEEQGMGAAAYTVARSMAEELRHSPLPLLAAGRVAFAEGWWSEALADFRSANRRGRTAYGLRMEAESLLELGRVDEALAVLRVARSSYPADDDVRAALDSATALAEGSVSR